MLKRISNLLLVTATLLCAYSWSTEEHQADLRIRMQGRAQRDFASHARASGISELSGPLNVLEKKFKQTLEDQSGVELSNLEAKVLFRHPQQLPRIKILKEISYGISGRICHDSEAEGNETDSARHFIAAYSLSLMAGEAFAYQYMTAHEGWLVEEDPNQFSAYNFASSIMDLHNNMVGIRASRAEQLWIPGTKLSIQVYSIEKIRSLAIAALRKVRHENRLVAVYNNDGPCAQPQQRQTFRNAMRVSEETPIW